MDHVESLIHWIITYSVEGNFFHFMGCLLIVTALVRVLHFFRINVEIKRRTKKKSEGKS